MSNILYKYRDWGNSYHRNSFIESELFFSNSFNFNDPYDLQLPLKIKGVLKFDERSFIRDFQNEHGKLPSKEFIKLAQQKWPEIMEQSPLEKTETFESYSQAAKELEDNLGVLCLSKSCKNILMWGHYANSHKGFCIGINKKLFRKYLRDEFSKRCSIYDVNYTTRIPELSVEDISDTNKLRKFADKRFTTKFKNWEYEDEIRIIIGDYANKILKVPVAIIKEVVFGFKMSETDIKPIKILSKSVYPHIKFFKSEPSKNGFRMVIKEMENEV